MVTSFNAAINARDLAALVALMSPDHRFVDSAGRVVAGRDECRDAWRSFFDSFPDYRNIFASIELVSAGEVVVEGRSECAVAPLEGPARWRAKVQDGFVTEWRIDDVAPSP